MADGSPECGVGRVGRGATRVARQSGVLFHAADRLRRRWSGSTLVVVFPAVSSMAESTGGTARTESWSLDRSGHLLTVMVEHAGERPPRSLERFMYRRTGGS